MKKNLNIILMFLIAASFLFFNGCDELSNFEVNVPLPIEFHIYGSDNSITESEGFCLSQYEAWRENADNVESAKWLAASYWTLKDTLTNVTSANLTGDITWSLLADDGNILFTKTYNNLKVADYESTALKIELNEFEIQLVDAYLEGIKGSDKCFTGILNVNVTDGVKNNSGEYELHCKVELVLSTDVKTNP